MGTVIKNNYTQEKNFCENLSPSLSVQHIRVSFPLPENHSIYALYPWDGPQERIQVSGDGSDSRCHSSSDWTPLPSAPRAIQDVCIRIPGTPAIPTNLHSWEMGLGISILAGF